MEEYLIVGLGLAGIALCETLEEHGRSFQVVDHGAPSASTVAGGIYNPVVLKRISVAWKAAEQLPLVTPFYSSLEEKLQMRFHKSLPVLRRFASVEEQNLWFEARDSPGLEPFLSAAIEPNRNQNLHAPYGYGKVLGTGRVATNTLVKAYRAYLQAGGRLREERFDPRQMVLSKDGVTYGDIRALRIVFATGAGLREMDLFQHLPLGGNKGEYLEIHCPALKEERIVKASVFLIPLGEDRYSVGATYDQKDHDRVPTPGAAIFLRKKLEEFLRCRYTVTEQVAGIRPVVADRRPLVGKHPGYERVYVLNGFGSRGVMIAPYAAQKLFRAMEFNEPLDPEMDIDRFRKRFIHGRKPLPGNRNG